jgi:hypothetical protein
LDRWFAVNRELRPDKIITSAVRSAEDRLNIARAPRPAASSSGRRRATLVLGILACIPSASESPKITEPEETPRFLFGVENEREIADTTGSTVTATCRADHRHLLPKNGERRGRAASSVEGPPRMPIITASKAQEVVA